MRYLKLASAKNPDNDFIELNDFNGFLCTSFQSLGISRKLEFLTINNRQFSVDNKPNFKKYNLTIEILTRYSEWEAKYRELTNFLDRNKLNGFRLYYRPYNNMPVRYCLCDIETSTKTEKLQPVVLALTQNSLWYGEEQEAKTAYNYEDEGNIFAFTETEDVDNYYSVGFYLDKNIVNYYCVSFYRNIETQALIINNSYNEIPLNMKIIGPCVNPVISLFKKGENTPIRETQVYANIDDGYYIEINSNILENGVWYVNGTTGKKNDYSDRINNSLGSPYFYIDNGEYYITVKDDNLNLCETYIFWKEEYSE